MREIITIATNEIYSKKEDGTMQKRFEVIVLTGEPKWKLTNQQDLTKEREVTEFRFITKSLITLGEALIKMEKDSDTNEDSQKHL